MVVQVIQIQFSQQLLFPVLIMKLVLASAERSLHRNIELHK